MARKPWKRTLEDELLDFTAICQRCGPLWESAHEHARDAGVPVETFASPSWDCSLCSHFFECLLEGKLLE